METWRLADLHAYVDDCMEPDERLAFESQMADDPALARRVAVWRAQNTAIRSAFDGEGARAFPISIVHHQNENLGKGRRPASAGGKTSREQAARPSSPDIAGASRHAAKTAAPAALRMSLSWRRLALAAVSVCLICIWSPSRPFIPAEGLGEAGVAAFRAFARPGVGPVEFAASDTAESQEWLTTRLSRPVYLPATPAAVELIGARIAPSPAGAAAFLVYKSEQRLLGLLVLTLDAPVTGAPSLLAAEGRTAAVWTWGGQGFALVGDLEAPALLKMATDFFSSPLEAVQAMPARGS
jgi:anti-sigma factor RsiW